MNPTKKPARLVRLTRRLALAASLVAAGPLVAEEADPAYTMTVIVDAAHGSKVAAGKYEHAIEKITAGKSSRDAYSKQTNLCVAYTKTGALEKATAACEAALAIMLDGAKPRSNVLAAMPSEKHDRVYLALALSNLGVLHAAKGSTDIARRTFREAVELDTGLSAPKINLARLAREETPSA
jgi:tetratricopeptide (TPR) repeat protein